MLEKNPKKIPGCRGCFFAGDFSGSDVLCFFEDTEEGHWLPEVDTSDPNNICPGCTALYSHDEE